MMETRLTWTVNIIIADYLAVQGTRALIGMILTQLSWNIKFSAPEGLMNLCL